MSETESLTTTESVQECKCCFEKVNSTDQFCQNCGFPVKGTEQEQAKFFLKRNYEYMEMDAHNKKIKSAGTSLYVLSGIFLLYGLVFFFIRRTEDDASAILITYGIVAVIFLLLGLWAATKPVASFISGLVLFGLLVIMEIIDDPANIIKGLLFKIVIIGYLIKGLISALEADRLKKAI